MLLDVLKKKRNYYEVYIQLS